jgi:hypothetical protein
LLRRRPFLEPGFALVLTALVTMSGVARAATPPTDAEVSQARERFAAARKLENTGKWAEALTLFQRVAEVKMTPQVRFHVALCMENVGLWTQALDGYQQAIREATAAPDVLKEATEHLHKLEAMMPTVSVAVQGAAPGDELYLDRRRLPLDDSPLPIRADPGPHTAEVKRGSALLAREYFALTPKSTLRVDLRVGNVAPEPLDKAAEPKASPLEPKASPPETPPEQPPPVPPPGPAPRDRSALRAAGWAAIGLSGASLVATSVFIGLRAGAMNRLKMACPALKDCSPGVADIVSEGKRDATLVNVFAVMSGVAAAGGISLLLLSPSPAKPLATMRSPVARLEARAAAGGISFEGWF